MPEWLSSIFSLSHEISSKVALPICITTAIILFLPDSPAAVIGIDEARHAYRIWIGLLFLLSTVAVVVNILWAGAGLLRQPIRDWFFVWANKGVFQNLLEDEKKILRMFIDDGQASINAAMNDGTINLLEHKRIISRSADLSVRFNIFPYVMHPWAREYLLKHRDLLD